MANAWEQVSWIGAEALRHLEDALVVIGMCAKDVTSEYNVRPNGYSVGDTVSFKTRPEYSVQEFSTSITTQDILESKRSLKIEKHYDVSVAITAKEMALDLESFSSQVIVPAAYALASKVEVYVASKISEACGLYVSDTLLETAADMALARKAATIQQLNNERFGLVDLNLEATMLGKDYFSSAAAAGGSGERTLATALLGYKMGCNWYSSINFPTPASAFTPGTMVCQTDNGTSGTQYNKIGDTSLIVDTQTASQSVKVGDRLQIAGVRRPLKVKTAIVDTTSTTEVELVDPISEVIPDNAAVTVIGTTHNYTIQGAIFDSQSIAVAFPMLDAPADKPSVSVSNNGVSIRVVTGYDMTTKKTTLSMDLLVGAFALDPRRITLLASY